MENKFEELRRQKYELRVNRKTVKSGTKNVSSAPEALYPYCPDCRALHLSFYRCPIMCDHCNSFLFYVPLPLSFKDNEYEKRFDPPVYKRGGSKSVKLLKDIALPEGEESWVDSEEDDEDDDDIPF